MDNIIKESIDDLISHLANKIKTIEEMIDKFINDRPELKENSELLISITGIGEKTINKILAFLGDVTKFDTAKKMAAFVYLNPQNAQSGTLLNYSYLSKTGDAELRKLFFMPALVAIQHEPNIKAFYERLISKGKAKKVAICAVMRKIVHIIYGVLKSRKPFDAKLIGTH